MIDLLIRDCANIDRSDNRFPWMRNFDPYAGHSWASGHAGFASGNNQESSSESMNFASSLVIYGEATGNTAIRDLGIFWHSTKAEAIRQYWFDQDNEVFPQGYGHTCVGMVWGDGATYGTWWTANPEEIHGINYLPITGGSLYLGRDPDYVRRNFEDMLESNRRFHNGGFEGDPEKIGRWHDILAEYSALASPTEAIGRFVANGRQHKPEFGETRTHSMQWLSALAHLGQVDSSVSANHPLAVVFDREGQKTRVVWNFSEDKTVKFSDGKQVQAGRGLTVHRD